MTELQPEISFLFNISKFQTKLSRRLDSVLNGIGFTELIILYHLSQAQEEKLRRIDLADKVGLTASGITRLLLPMEKIGLIKREANEHDARSSPVVLAPGGKTKLSEGLERLEIFCEEAIPQDKAKKIAESSRLLTDITKNI